MTDVSDVLGDPVLDNPAWNAMTGPQAQISLREGRAARFEPGISPFVSAAGDDLESWADLRRLLGPGASGLIAGAPLPLPVGWTETLRLVGYQMVGTDVEPLDDAELVELGETDGRAMLDLANRTRPGPYALRTREFGGYLGVYRDGALVAMAGERMHPPGWTEISAVCTDESVRGEGLGGRLVRAVATNIIKRGEQPMLHVAGSNVGAVRLYEKLGFHIRRDVEFVAFTVPAEG